MDVNHKVSKTDSENDDLNGVDSPTAVVLDGESDGEDESQSLLHPKKGGMSEKPEKPRRKVQWLDKNGTGSQLAEILEFQPSDASDSDDDDSDSCICTIL